jgi:predicted outer membrane repeat protein
MKTAWRLLATVITITVSLHASIIEVPADYPTIQQAIDASMAGDTVLVAPGTYLENIDFKGKDILLKSTGGAAVTTIDGSSPSNPAFASVVAFINGESVDAVIEGFTLAYGKGTLYNYYPGEFVTCGGGIFCFGASPTIRMNVIVHNEAEKRGGGIYCNDSSAVILENTISDNETNLVALSGGIEGGGGIFCESAYCVIAGNTITNNAADPVEDGDGGGILCYKSFVTVSENTIHGNVAQSGGGIANYDSTCLINGNKMTDNTAVAYGGGIYSDSMYHTTIEHNLIDNNTSDFGGGGMFAYGHHEILKNTVSNNISSYSGGGMSLGTGEITLQDNIITGNEAVEGGGLDTYGGDYFFMNNMIHGNHASESGGGMCLMEVEDAFTVYNTFAGNTAAQRGGAIACQEDSELVVINAILWNNSAPSGKELWIGYSYYAWPSTVSISESDVQGGLSSTYVEPGFTLEWGPNMIDADPQFVDEANGDLHILYTSPCKDTGCSIPQLPPRDFENNPRIAYYSSDMGADEFYPHLYINGDTAPGGQIEGMLLGPAGATPVGLFFGSGVLNPPYWTPWGMFHLKMPLLYVSLVPIPPNGLLKIPATLPLNPPAPYDVPMQALIGLDPLKSLTELYMLEVR